jgi:hypothetical protein
MLILLQIRKHFHGILKNYSKIRSSYRSGPLTIAVMKLRIPISVKIGIIDVHYTSILFGVFFILFYFGSPYGAILLTQ